MSEAENAIETSRKLIRENREIVRRAKDAREAARTHREFMADREERLIASPGISQAINPLLRLARHQIISTTIDRKNAAIILMIKNQESPLTVWFRSVEELNQAYAEWILKSKESGS